MTADVASKPHRTLAQAARERRDIVTGEVMDEDRLIRFVAGPDGTVVPDLARKLPGRGLWVAADRASVETAARKGLFSRAAKARLAAAPNLADQVADLLQRRLLAGLGLARKSGDLVMGFEKVAAALRGGKVAVLVEALDGAADGRGKMLGVAARAQPPPIVIGLFTTGELGLALGGENVVHSACLAGRTSDRWTFDARRLSGFRPLLPESWREEP
ncbi:MAG: RNA-binding protein [Proteobacteria bacterium]|nr:RNA-binding protein [Pseudomonadota bacterium]